MHISIHFDFAELLHFILLLDHAFIALLHSIPTTDNGHVHKLNLSDLDQSRAILSGARPFINYLRAIHYTFVNSGVKQSDRWNLIQAKSATKAPHPFVYISSAPNATWIIQMLLLFVMAKSGAFRSLKTRSKVTQGHRK